MKKINYIYILSFAIILLMLISLFKNYVIRNMVTITISEYSPKVRILENDFQILKNTPQRYIKAATEKNGKHIIAKDCKDKKEIEFLIFQGNHEIISGLRTFQSPSIFDEIQNEVFTHFSNTKKKFFLYHKYGYIVFRFNLLNSNNSLTTVYAGYRNKLLFSNMEKVWLIAFFSFLAIVSVFIISYAKLLEKLPRRIPQMASGPLPENTSASTLFEKRENIKVKERKEQTGEKFYKEELIENLPETPSEPEPVETTYEESETLSEPQEIIQIQNTKETIPSENTHKEGIIQFSEETEEINLKPDPAPILVNTNTADNKYENTANNIQEKEKSAAEQKDNDNIRNFQQVYEYKKQLEEEVEDLSIVREISLCSNTITDFDTLVQQLLALINSRIETDKIQLFLKQQNNNDVLFLKGRLENNQLETFDINSISRFEEKIVLGFGPEGKALEKNTSIIYNINDHESIVTVPLIDKNKAIGAMRLYKNEANFYKEKDKFILLKLACHLALAINNVLLYETAITDGLTQLYVHRHFQHTLENEITRARRYHENLSLSLIDIDFFKKFNDTYGHQAGDLVLIEVAKILRENIRTSDQAFRYGGEEFAVIFPNTASIDAESICNKLRSIIELSNFNYLGTDLSVTISTGFTSLNFRELEKEVLISEADKALYAAKDNGRNCVVNYEAVPIII